MRHCLLTAAAVLAAMTVTARAQVPAPDTPEGLVAAAKRAAGRDHAGTFLRICVAPDNLSGAPRPPPLTGARTVPDRATWYAAPYKVFDDLYFVGTQIHSSWALTTTDGIIVIDQMDKLCFAHASPPTVGTVKRKMVPPPVLASNQMRPP